MTLDKVIKHAEEVASRKFDDRVPCINCVEEHRQIAEWLKELKQLREQTQWIPVKDRLPEEDGRFLTYIVNPYNNQLSCITVCEYMYQEWWPDDESASCNVIAWMPLPRPYKEENE